MDVSRFLGSEEIEALAVGGSPVVRRGERVADLSVNCAGDTVERRNIVLGIGFGEGCLGLSKGDGARLILWLANDEDDNAGLNTALSSTASSSLSLAQTHGPE